MDNSETIRLILEMTGSQSLDEAAQKLQTLKTRGTELADTYKILERQVGEYGVVEEQVSKRTKEYSEEQAASRRAVNQIIEESIAEQKALATTVNSTATAHGNMGRGVLQTSYAVQDFTSVLSGGGGLSRALGSVQNNIPVLLTGLGVGAGLAGTISLVSVGLGAAIPLLMQFAGAEEKASDATQKLTQESERLRNLPSSAEAAAKGNMEAFLKGMPARVVEGGIRAALTSRAQGQAEQQAQQELQTFGVMSKTPEQIMAGWAPQIETDTQRLFTGMLTNETDAGFVASLAQERPGAFPPGFVKALNAATRGIGGPEKDAAAERQAHEEIERGKHKQNEEIKKRAELRQRQDAEERKSRQDLTDQGREDEAAFWKQVERDKLQEQRDAHAVDVATKQAEDRQKREAEEEAKRAARENTADKRKDRAISSEFGRQEPGEIDPDFRKKEEANASENMMLGASIARAVDVAIRQTRYEIFQGFNHEMARATADSESRIP